MSNLALVKQEGFGNLMCDFYKNSNDEILMTREQIGMALEYKDPMVAIAKIHLRNSDRFSKFSFTRMVNGREIYFYTSKGIYEICRWSRQPKADQFIDFAWEVIDNIRKVLMQKQTQEWKDARITGKLHQHELSDAIRDFAEYAKSQGSQSSDKYYIHFSKLTNSVVGLKSGERSMATSKVLTTQTFILELIKRTIEEEMAKGTYYKSIYDTCKRKVNEFMQYVSIKQIGA